LPEPRRRGGAASVLVGRKIYVSHGNRGGHETGNHSTTLGWLDYYDLDENKWYTNLPDAPNPRDHTGGAYVNGRFCVAGGRDGGDPDFFNKVILPTDCYDPVTNTWSMEANIPQGRAGSRVMESLWLPGVKVLEKPGRMWMCLMVLHGGQSTISMLDVMVQVLQSIADAIKFI
jgi:hypothetical protein